MATARDRRRSAAAPALDEDEALAGLHAAFERLRRRHARLGRMLRRTEVEAENLTRASRRKVTTASARDRVGYHEIWSRWSRTYDEAAVAADGLLRSSPRSLVHLSMMFDALEWVLLVDRVIVDRGVERQVRRFGRGLHRLAASR